MVETRQLSVKNGDVLVLVGTMKGTFMLRSNAARSRWEMGGPHHPGHAVYALAFDQREGRRRIWAGPGTEHWGSMLSSSDDFGHTWTKPESALIRFPEDTGTNLKRIWQIRPGPVDEPQTLYCGVEPAALFESLDGGESWSLMRGLWNHPHREKWMPGGGGLCLHTILPDPAGRPRLTVAVSAAGVYRSDDGGHTWQVRNHGVRAEFLPDKYPEFGQCVHKIVHHPSNPDRLFLQNHWGLYRSDNGGDSWKDIANGVPSDFGFAMSMHPHDPDTVYILPIESDLFRCTPDARLRVYRTRDGGASWESLENGLPQKDAFETVLRDGMDVDRLNPAGVYFGTRSGQVWASPNGGHSWSAIAAGLPPVLCVRAVVVGDPSKVRVPKPAKAKRASASSAKRAAKPKRVGGAKAKHATKQKRAGGAKARKRK
ncbi:MAG: exo-alpha-sialidase [Candidatus Eisenbacteria bacterium]|nr:exo-alpha-sialidase [Candidatus Eisenbacteria bacterium]